MKKVLIIANLFHASPRIPGIAMHLKEFGWEPTIITPSIANDFKKTLAFPNNFEKSVRIIETPYFGDTFEAPRKLLAYLGLTKGKSMLGQVKEKAGVKSKRSIIDFIFKMYATFFSYPDEERKWKNLALKSAFDILENEKFDAIISSSSPVTTHIVANKIKEKYGLYWLADFRDLWTKNHNYPYPFFRKFFETQLEKKILSSADILVTVSDPLVSDLSKLHYGKKAVCITNGFFEEEFNFLPTELKNSFLITYAGSIYTGKQDPKDFFIALRELISEKKIDRKDVEVRFFCGIMPWLSKEIEDMGFSDIAKVYEKVKRNEVAEKQNESQALLLIYWGDKKQKGVQSLKIFGYLAARRPIIVINGCGGDVVETVIKDTGSGAYCKNITEIKNYLERLYNEYKSNGRVLYYGDTGKIRKYSYKEKAKEISVILESI